METQNQTPQESDATIYRRMFVDVWRALSTLRADHQSLQETLMDEIPISDRLRVLEQYDIRRKQLWEDAALELEKKFPSLAAELDKHRPLQPPD